MTRVLPQSLDAERSLLGGILLDGTAFAAVAKVISADDFADIRHAIIFSGMRELARSGLPIDRVSAKDQLDRDGHLDDAGGEDFIDLLDQVVPAAANLVYYAKIVAEKALLRRIILAAETIAKLGYEWHGTAEEFHLEAQRRIGEARKSARSEVARAA